MESPRPFVSHRVGRARPLRHAGLDRPTCTRPLCPSFGRLLGDSQENSAHLCCDITSLSPVPLRCRVAKKRPRVQGTLTTSMVSCWKLRPPGICGVLRDAGCLNKKTPEHSQERLLCPTNLHSGRHFMGCWNGCAKSCPPCQLMSWQTCANVCAR